MTRASRAAEVLRFAPGLMPVRCFSSLCIQFKARMMQILNSRIDNMAVELPNFKQYSEECYDSFFDLYYYGDGENQFLPSMEKGLALLSGEVHIVPVSIPDGYIDDEGRFLPGALERLEHLEDGVLFSKLGLDKTAGKALHFLEEDVKGHLEWDPEQYDSYPLLLILESKYVGAFLSADLPASEEVEEVKELWRNTVPMQDNGSADMGVCEKTAYYGAMIGQIDSYVELSLADMSLHFYPQCVILREKLDMLNERYHFFDAGKGAA